MAYCNDCKEAKPDDQKFCNNCGGELVAPPPAESAAPQQPVYSSEQFQQHKAQAMGIYNRLSNGLKIAAIGAAACAVFSLATMIWFLAVGGGMAGPFLWMVLSGAAALFLVYLAGTNEGDKRRTLYVAGVISLGSMWVPSLFVMGTFGGFMPSGFSALMTIAAIGGVVEAVGGFIELARTR